ncbi:MAG: hypothetical protein IT495_00020 [Gammaproteobacteria bacterium]|nr:hypothetical protein [Gammaproteobacteria bacterium]
MSGKRRGPTRALAAGSALLLVALTGAAGWRLWRAPAAPAPYALWRDGRIVEVRGCDRDAPMPDSQRCGWLACAAAVTQLLVNPMEGTLRPLPRSIVPATGVERIRGNIDYRTSLSVPLMRAFECHLQGATLTHVRLLPDPVP